MTVSLNDEEPVRGRAWALGRIGTEAARQALRGRDEVEEDARVREEIGVALGEIRQRNPGLGAARRPGRCRR